MQDKAMADGTRPNDPGKPGCESIDPQNDNVIIGIKFHHCDALQNSKTHFENVQQGRLFLAHE